MEINEALGVIAEVCAAFHGTLAQHQQIQTALDVVAKAVQPEPAEPELVSANGAHATENV